MQTQPLASRVLNRIVAALVITALFMAAIPVNPVYAAGTISVLQAWADTPSVSGTTGINDTSFVVSPGSNRLMVVAMDFGSNNLPVGGGLNVYAVYGHGSSAPKLLTQISISDDTQRQVAWMGYLKEADIAAAGNTNLRVTVTNLPTAVGSQNGINIYVSTYAGVDQTAPITEFQENFSAGSPTLNYGNLLTVNAGGYALFSMSADANFAAGMSEPGYIQTALSPLSTNGSYSYQGGKTYGSATVTNPTFNWGVSQSKGVVAATLNPALPATTITLNALSAVTYGTAVTFTATVSPTPTNGVTVQFYDGVTLLGSGVTSGGVASYTTPATQLSATTSPHSITAKFVGNGSFAASTSPAMQQVVNKRSLTVSGITAGNKTYDGSISASLDTGSAALVGNLDGGNVTLNTGSATGSFSPNANAGVGKTVQITGLNISGSASGNYSLTPPTTTASIDPAPLEVTANDKTVYLGSPTPAFDFTATGFVAPDAFTVVPTCSVTGSPVAAGDYPINCSGGDAGTNYTISYVDGTYSISNKVVLNVSASSAAITYGDAAPLISPAYDGFIDNDTMAVLDVLPTCSVSGPFTVVASPFTSSCSGGSDDKYGFNYINGAVTVAPKDLTITADNAVKTYGETVAFNGDEFTASGLINNDGVNLVTLTSSGAVDTANVGGYDITPSAALGVGLGNYEITYVDGTLSVDKAGLVVSALSQTRAFGAADPAFLFDLSGLQNGETAAVLDTAPTCIVSVPHGSPGAYPITCSGGSDDNYSFTSYIDGTLTVSSVNFATFADVPVDHWAWKYIESLYAFGVSGGCGSSPLSYCPLSAVTRDQMAVFLLKAKYGTGYTPPAVGAATGFNDVPTDHWAAAWIKQLAVEGITAGCGGGNYCPTKPVTRDQMAVFLLRAKYGNTYTPPAVGAASGFNDVSTSHWAAAWIKQLAAEGVTGGCGGGNYCPSATILRDQMSVFLVAAFSLPTP